jgi:hypothetical protein
VPPRQQGVKNDRTPRQEHVKTAAVQRNRSYGGLRDGKERTVADVIFVALTLVTFGALVLLARGVDRL